MTLRLVENTNSLWEKNAEFIITVELDHDVMNTEECNVMVNSEELIGTTE